MNDQNPMPPDSRFYEEMAQRARTPEAASILCSTLEATMGTLLRSVEDVAVSPRAREVFEQCENHLAGLGPRREQAEALLKNPNPRPLPDIEASFKEFIQYIETGRRLIESLRDILLDELRTLQSGKETP